VSFDVWRKEARERESKKLQVSFGEELDS